MATSSITANFYCDNAKAANEFVRLLAMPTPVIKAPKLPFKIVTHETAAQRRAFIAGIKRRWGSSVGSDAK